ncbi:regucalcin-like protein [Caldalkalibacillus thermarum]|nr:regucalcin-like protein [Caldalkalibacillus thermarum]
MVQAELVFDAKATLGEGPSWDVKKKRLYWVDIDQKKVHIYDPNRNENTSLEIGQLVSAVVPRESGGLVMVTENGFFTFDFYTRQLCPIADPESYLPENRFNNGKCDAMGRFWAGTMHKKELPEQGSLYCLETNKVNRVLNHVSISNGISWSPDNQIFYYVDTPTKEVVAFDFDLDSGELKNKRVVVRIPDGAGVPDGMTTDTEGMIWVAHWGGYKVTRWNPMTGDLLDTIHLPVAKVTSCVFGGDDLDHLYITTARVGLSDEERLKQPYAGGLFCVKTKVKGLPTYPFKG